MTPGVELKPVSLRRDGDGLAIEWLDGARTIVGWTALRKNCPCASCNELRQKPVDPFKLLSDNEVAAGSPEPVRMILGWPMLAALAHSAGAAALVFTLTTLLARSSLARSSPDRLSLRAA